MGGTDRSLADRALLKGLQAKEPEEDCRPLHSSKRKHSIIRHKLVSLLAAPGHERLLRKHLPRMFSLIKNESWGLEDVKIPSQSHP